MAWGAEQLGFACQETQLQRWVVACSEWRQDDLWRNDCKFAKQQLSTCLQIDPPKNWRIKLLPKYSACNVCYTLLHTLFPVPLLHIRLSWYWSTLYRWKNKKHHLLLVRRTATVFVPRIKCHVSWMVPLDHPTDSFVKSWVTPWHITKRMGPGSVTGLWLLCFPQISQCRAKFTGLWLRWRLLYGEITELKQHVSTCKS